MSYLSEPYEPDTDSDYVYYNLSIINNSTIDTGQGTNYPVVSYSESRTYPILQSIDRYVMSIIRFSMNGVGLNTPLFIPQVQIGQNDPDLTVYSITLDLSGTYDIGGVQTHIDLSSQKFIEWSPEFTTEPTPKPPIETQEIATSRYYWTTTYDHFLGLVNDTFQQARDDLSNQLGTLYPGTSLITQAPIMLRDPTSNLFSLLCDTYGFGGNDRISKLDPSADEDITLHFNSNMYGLFANFQTLFTGQDLNQGREWKIIVKNLYGQNITSQTSPSSSPAPTTKYYQITQSNPSTATLWNPLSSIVFTTSLIPAVVELQGNPLVVGQNAVGSLPSSSNFANIITDIEFNNTPEQGRGLLQYLPTAEYRYCSLGNSKQPLRAIDMRVYFKTRLSNELIPLTMFPLSSVDVKILFRKKTAGQYQKY
jgi:hypothetical protein